MTSPLSPSFPRTSGAGTPYPVANTQAVNDLLTMMKSTLNTLGATFDSLGEQSAKVASLGPALDSARQIHELRKQMRHQEKVRLCNRSSSIISGPHTDAKSVL